MIGGIAYGIVLSKLGTGVPVRPTMDSFLNSS